MRSLSLHSRLRFDLAQGSVDGRACVQQLDLNTAWLELRVLKSVDSHFQLLVPAPIPLSLRLLIVHRRARVCIILKVHDLLLQAVLPQDLLTAGLISPLSTSLMLSRFGVHQILPQVVD